MIGEQNGARTVMGKAGKQAQKTVKQAQRTIKQAPKEARKTVRSAD